MAPRVTVREIAILPEAVDMLKAELAKDGHSTRYVLGGNDCFYECVLTSIIDETPGAGFKGRTKVKVSVAKSQRVPFSEM